MGTETTPAAKVRTPKPEGERTYGVTLKGGDGETLRFLAIPRKAGHVSVFAQHIQRDDKGHVKNSSRGASSTEPSMDAAKASIEKLRKAALGQGWVERRAGGGVGRSKPDAFDLRSLPAPKPAAKAAKK